MLLEGFLASPALVTELFDIAIASLNGVSVQPFSHFTLPFRTWNQALVALRCGGAIARWSLTKKLRWWTVVISL